MYDLSTFAAKVVLGGLWGRSSWRCREKRENVDAKF